MPAKPLLTSRRAVLRGMAAIAASGIAAPAVAQPRRGQPRQGGGQDDETFDGVPIIDTHAHLLFRRGDHQSLHAAGQTALAAMDRLKISRTLLLPPPQPYGFANGYDAEDLAPVIRQEPHRFGFLAGGGTLNGMLHRHARSRDVPADVVRDFERRALAIVEAGAAGFGELTAEHLSFEPNHPYEAAPPDHPLLLRLDEIAADRGLPIDLHMEAVPRDMDTPADIKARSRLNPARLAANIERFERLLAHRRGARIVWVHAGWDSTGERTPELMARLLRDHPNLFMNIKIFGRPDSQPNSPLVPPGQLRPAWLTLLRQFPDRFAIGSDSFHAGAATAGRRPPANPATRILVNALPPDLAAKVASENARRIYRLPAG